MINNEKLFIKILMQSCYITNEFTCFSSIHVYFSYGLRNRLRICQSVDHNRRVGHNLKVGLKAFKDIPD